MSKNPLRDEADDDLVQKSREGHLDIDAMDRRLGTARMIEMTRRLKDAINEHRESMEKLANKSGALSHRVYCLTVVGIVLAVVGTILALIELF